MRYLQDGGFQRNPLMRLSLGLTLVLLLGFWATNAAMYFTRMGLTRASVARYYNGSEEDFTPPRSAESMLETSHMHLPMMGMVLLFLTHLAIFVPSSRRSKTAVILAAFAGALAQEGGGWLVRFVSPSLAAVKIAGFLALQGSILWLLAVLALFLWRAARAASAGAPAPHAAGERAPRPEPALARVSLEAGGR